MRVQGRPEDSPENSLRLPSEENSKMIQKVRLVTHDDRMKNVAAQTNHRNGVGKIEKMVLNGTSSYASNLLN